MDVTRVKTSSGIVIVSVNCQSCGGPLQSTYGRCRCSYCGNTNIILENGKTRVLIGDYYVKGKNINPAPKSQTSGLNWVIIVVMVIVGGVAIWYLIKRKKEEDPNAK